MTRRRNRRSDRLLAVLEEYTRVAVITHDTPDPDAIAAGWAIHTLVRQRLNRPARLIGGGAIMRAENAHLVRILQPPLELVNDFAPGADCAPVLVDCSPEGANHLLGDGQARPVAVIDHHKAVQARIRVRHRDIRPRAAAAATIAASYLREQDLTPSPELATALIYAVRTEAHGRRERFTRSDRGVLTWLGPWVDHQRLTEIEDAPLSRPYYEELMLALGTTFLYDDVAVCFLPLAAGGEIVGEVADLLIRCTEIRRVLCGAVVGGALILSARTARGGGDAVRLVGATLKGLGHWGGHHSRAGGRIVGDGQEPRITQQTVETVKTRWLEACHANAQRGVRLVTRKEIAEIL